MQKFELKHLLIIVLSLSIMACEWLKGPSPYDLNSCLVEHSIPGQPLEIPVPELKESSIDSLETGIVCKVNKYRYAPGFEESILLDPTSDVIYPGALLEAGSVVDGSYRSIVAKRTPIILSKSGTGAYKKVEQPTLSSTRRAVYDLSKSFGTQETQITAEIQEVYSSDHLRLVVSGSFKSGIANIESNFEWQNSNIASRFVIQFQQVYYSIDVDGKEKISDWFEGEAEDFCGGLSHLPMYVSSVKYGRTGLMLFESTASSKKVSAALRATFGTEQLGGGLEVRVEDQEVWESSNFKILIVGGSPSDGVAAINDLEGFNHWIRNGGTHSEASPGSPIAYSLRYIDGRVAKIVQAAEYEVRECSPTALTRTEFIHLNDSNSIRVCPTHIAGDREFNGNGPIQKAYTRLYTKGKDELWLELRYNVKETVEDWTEGDFSDNFLVWKASEHEEFQGYQIESILSPAEFHTPGYPSEGILDTDTSIDVFPEVVNTDNFVKRFVMMGDTSGEDLAASETTIDQCKPEEGNSWLRIEFNPVEIVLTLL